MYLIVVDEDRCTGCGACVSICPADVFTMIEDKADPINASDCTGCRSCIEVCEPESLDISEL
jgi:NAD-dependent dihydropyrimidine dehydrogenase PreA subunit